MVLGTKDELRLATLEKGLPGVNPTVGSYCAQACIVCFTRTNHKSGVDLQVEGIQSTVFTVLWDTELTDQDLRTWGDEATEHGACAIAFLLVTRVTEYTVLRRARTGTGIDYWLGYQDPNNILKEAARLEISGILHGNKSSIGRRTGDKKKQTKPSDGELPAYVVVVEFSRPLAQVVLK